MFDLLKEEVRKGKRVYLFEAISIIVFLMFLNIGYSKNVISNTHIYNGIITGWVVVNGLVLVIYEFYDFSKLINNQNKLEVEGIRGFIFKILIFVFLMSINIGWIISPSVSMILPLMSLLLGYWILLMSKDVLKNNKLGAVLGTMWFITLFMVIGLLNPAILMGVNMLIKNPMITQLFVNLLWLVGAMMLFKVVMKKLVGEYDLRQNNKPKKSKKASK